MSIGLSIAIRSGGFSPRRSYDKQHRTSHNAASGSWPGFRTESRTLALARPLSVCPRRVRHGQVASSARARERLEPDWRRLGCLDSRRSRRRPMPIFHTAIKSAALAAALGLSATAALAQAGGAPSPKGQTPAPATTQPSDPAAASNPATAPQDRTQGGAATGAGAGSPSSSGVTNPNESPANTPLSPAESGGPRPGGGTGGEMR